MIRKMAVRETANLQREINDIESDLKQCARNNAQVLDQFRAEVFSRLAHEAFHAYLENYVYPHEKYDVPRWLNEGMAVMFENGQLDSDTLRVDAPNRRPLARLNEDLRGAKPLSLEGLLTAGPDAFLEDNTSNRHYAHSWGVVYYLTFRRGLLANSALDRYLQPAAAAGQTPVQRFEQFVGIPLDEFERKWREYVAGL